MCDCLLPPSSHTHQPLLCCRSVLLLDYVFKPALHLGLSAVVGPASAAAISGALVGLYHVLWLFPAYLISFLVNCIWCGPVCQRSCYARRAGGEGVGPRLPAWRPGQPAC